MSRYRIHAKRSTTISHAFASAMAPIDVYDESKVDEVLNQLGCVREGKIFCVYCGEREAQTWDHLFALVKDSDPSGHGHTYGNLVPACKDCNSIKGNKDWRAANMLINRERPAQLEIVERVVGQHVLNFPFVGVTLRPELVAQLKEIKAEIMDLMKRADELVASSLRST